MTASARARWRLAACVLVAVALGLLAWQLVPAPAHAAGSRECAALIRPGGGHTYGGGSSSDDSGDLIGALVWLCFEEPEIGIPLLIVVLVIVAVRKRLSARQGGDWQSARHEAHVPPIIPATSRGAPAPVLPGPAGVRNELEKLRAVDPEFSLVLFEDFVYALYAAAHEARGGSKLYDLRAYLSEQARGSLESMACAEVEAVVIGSMRPERVDWRRYNDRDWVGVLVAFESNYTETDSRGHKQTYYARERWELARLRDAKSKPPTAARVFGCPNCGAPYDKLSGNRCSYCDHILALGEVDWAVTRIVLEVREPRPPQLTGDAPEIGTDDPTVVMPGAEKRFGELRARDTSFSWLAFQQRVWLVFDELQKGWSSQRWELVRPFVSDQLFQMQLYWIDTYRRAKLCNVTENTQIAGIVISDVRSDKHYDAITVRLFASGLDYTLDEQGKVVSGSRKNARYYSEYWTLIRGASAHGAPRPTRECPSCGAPLEVNMAGSCTHCHAKITSGEFDWVLSRIEQDESYR
jgi:hypothetical protein